LSDAATFGITQTLRQIVASAPATVQVGQTVNLSAVELDANGNVIPAGVYPVTWSSANTAIATITGGVLSVIIPGTVQLTATANGVTASVTVAVAATAATTPPPDTSTVKRILVYGQSLSPVTSGGLIGTVTQPIVGLLNRGVVARPVAV